MLAFLKNLFRTAPSSGTTPTAEASRRMDLEERKAYRKECLYQSIRETFLSMEVVSQMYRFKVMPVDERHHRFIAMVDVAKSFVAGGQGRNKSFFAMEQSMRTAAYQRYGVVIDGIYWRVNESEEPFERSARASDPVRGGGAQTAALRTTPTLAKDGAPAATPLSRHRYPAVSAEDRAAFMAALQRGKAPPLVHVGEQEYVSDLMPLEGGGKTGGTQYGKL